MTIAIDNTYDVVSTERTENVVGMVEGTDPCSSTPTCSSARISTTSATSKADGRRTGRVNVPVTDDPHLERRRR